MRRECLYCGGTGYGSAARNSGNPNMIGIWQCDYCNGVGYHEPYVWTPEETQRLKKVVERVLKRKARKGL